MRAAVLILAAVAGPAVAQQADFPPLGSELFRGVLHRLKYEPVDGPFDNPRAVVVIGPPREYGRVLARLLPELRQQGGSVLVACDYDPAFAAMLPDAPPFIADTARRTVSERRPLKITGGSVFPVEPVDGGAEPVVPPGVVVAGNFALGRVPRNSGWRTIATRSPLALGACADAYGRTARTSRAVIFSDTSLFSNRLLAGRHDDDTDTGNLELAVNVARWLKPGDGPTRCLFVENGRVVTKFDEVNYDAALVPPLPAPAPPPLSALLEPEAQAKLTDAANEALDRVQSDDRFNAALTRRGRFPRTLQWLLGAAAVLAAVSLVSRARAARRPADPPPPQAPPAPTGAFAQRREEMLRVGDHTAAVREYLVELFRHHGLPLDEYRHPKRMPRVQADRPTRKRLATLWEAAYGPHPVSYTRWKELEPMIEAVRADAAAGRWRFAGGRA